MEISSKDLHYGDILLTRNEVKWYNPVTWIYPLIWWFTDSDFNHAVTVYLIDNKLFIVDAVGSGVRFMRYDLWEKSKNRIVKVLRNKNFGLRSEFYERLLNVSGKKYDFTSLFKHHPRMKFSKKWKGRVGEDALKKFTCSELAIYLQGIKNPETWSPEDINQSELFESIGSFNTVKPPVNNKIGIREFLTKDFGGLFLLGWWVMVLIFLAVWQFIIPTDIGTKLSLLGVAISITIIAILSQTNRRW